MIMKVHKPSSTPGADNKGSVSKLIDYLEKEKSSLENGGFFFGRTKDDDRFQDMITRTQAAMAIDRNIKGLKKKDSKFFMLTLNFSSKEQEHMASKIAGRKITDVDQLNERERQVYEQKMKMYTQKVMDEYAKNFNRGLTEKDMVYVSKIEHNRTYKGNDPEVLNGDKKSGDKKPGMHTHVHIVVSRQDATQTKSLSPNAKELKANSHHVLNGNKVTKGFNHEVFKLKTERLFDKEFAYGRKFHESYSAKSNNESLKSVATMYKNQLTPQEYKEMAALSDSNLNMVYRYFTKPNQAMLHKLNTNIQNQLSLKAKVQDQMLNGL